MKSYLMLTGAVVAISFATQADAAVLYGATAAGSPGELYILNSATGAVIQDVGPLNDALAQNYPITGLAFHPITGVLYGSTGNSVAAAAAKLVTIDPVTALVTVVGSFNAGNAGTPATMTDLAFTAAGALYGVGSVGGPQLYSINPATGQATIIGSTGLISTTGGGLAIGAGGNFYGTPTSTRFGTYNPITGAYTDIANPAKPVGGTYAGLEFDGADALYGLNLGSTPPPPTHLVTLNPTTGAVTDLGASATSLDAIAFAVPEPGALTMLLPAGFGLLNRRRKGC